MLLFIFLLCTFCKFCITILKPLFLEELMYGLTFIQMLTLFFIVITKTPIPLS
jgi:hypothetical protein